MKAPLKPRAGSTPRPDPEEVRRIAAEAAPHHPPAIATPAPPPPPTQQGARDAAASTTLNQRFRVTTVSNLRKAAKAQGLTMKQIVARGMQAMGVEVDPVDLEDRTPRVDE
jgi:hypothetical protein